MDQGSDNAERERFELSVGYSPTAAFQATQLNHSCTSPSLCADRNANLLSTVPRKARRDRRSLPQCLKNNAILLRLFEEHLQLFR